MGGVYREKGRNQKMKLFKIKRIIWIVNGDMMRIAMSKKGLSEQKLARLLGVTGPTIHRLKDGQSNPSEKLRKRIEEVLNG